MIRPTEPTASISRICTSPTAPTINNIDDLSHLDIEEGFDGWDHDIEDMFWEFDDCDYDIEDTLFSCDESNDETTEADHDSEGERWAQHTDSVKDICDYDSDTGIIEY